jgi:uncharacterized membrane protein
MKRYFISGLIILLPLLITFWIISFIVNFITRPFERAAIAILENFSAFKHGFGTFSESEVVVILSKILILLFLVFFLIVIGVICRSVFISSLLFLTDKVLSSTPFINRVYGACKDFTTALFSSKSKSFSEVVLVPYPSPAHLAIGLITGEIKNEVIPNNEEQMVSVLIPGTPNPTVGFALLYRKEQIIHIDMKPEDALKFIMSCGSVVPPNFLQGMGQ